ncbi:MAG: hypothetical protein J6B91_01445 [Prevotella sp.]|nr:hypothetical protein [Prevotella sp.]
MKKISHIYYIIITLAAVVASCSENARMTAVLNRADSLIMAEQPDSALMLIETAGLMKDDCSHSQLMRYELLKAKAINKSDMHVFTSDSTVKRLVSYYDSYGSRNEQMLTRYLLGSVYRDLGDAPRALECYRNAVEMADTTSADCDYYTLCRVHGQMAYLFHEYSSPEYEIEELRKAIDYSWKSKDTINALLAYESLGVAYYTKNEKDSLISIGLKVSRLYEKYGHHDFAVGALCPILTLFLDRKEYDKAKSIIDKLESESGKFDEYGNITVGNELYYDSKGRYYNGIGNLDSALYYFRKMAKSSDDMMCKEAYCRGLMNCYLAYNEPDSVAKYALLYCQQNDSAAVVRSSEEINRAKSLFDYNIAQTKMKKKTKEAENYKKMLFGIICILVVLAYLLYKLIKRRKRIMMQKLKETNEKYVSLLSKYANTKKELLRAYSYEEQYRIEKEKELQELRNIVAKYQTGKLDMSLFENEQELLFHPLVNKLHERATKAEKASIIELDELRNVMEHWLPDFVKFIRYKALSHREMAVCMLIRMCFLPSEIAVLLDVRPQSMTNIRTKINNKLFEAKGAKTLDENIRRLK